MVMHRLNISLGILGQKIADKIEEGKEAVGDSFKEQARELTKDIIFGILEGVRDVIVDLSYSIALIGGGLCIIFYVAGWDKGKRWAGILTVAYVLIKYILG